MNRVPLGMRLLARARAGGLGLVLQSQVPAVAAGCTGSTGVTVVVDHHQSGGGVQQACDADGGGKAASTVSGLGFPLTSCNASPVRVPGRRGALERSLRQHPTGHAYWSLWWSDGKSGTWSSPAPASAR